MRSRVRYKVAFKVRTDLPFTLFLGLCLIILLSMLSLIFYRLIISPDKIKSQILPVTLMIIAGLWLLDRFLWQIHGTEQLRISDKIEIVHGGKLFKSTSRIEFNEFESIYHDDRQGASLAGRLFGLRGGKIIIEYAGRKIRFGKHISTTMAGIVANEIDKEMGKITESMDL